MENVAKTKRWRNVPLLLSRFHVFVVCRSVTHLLRSRWGFITFSFVAAAAHIHIKLFAILIREINSTTTKAKAYKKHENIS